MSGKVTEWQSGKVKSYEDLEVWKLSIALVKSIYKFSSYFPAEEKFGLTSQIRRAAVSVPSNIAEGSERNGTKEYIQHIYISIGSLAEIKTQVRIAIELEFIQPSEAEKLIADISSIDRMLKALATSLKKLL